MECYVTLQYHTKDTLMTILGEGVSTRENSVPGDGGSTQKWPQDTSQLDVLLTAVADDE